MFEGAHLKIKRADKHIAELALIIGQFLRCVYRKLDSPGYGSDLRVGLCF